MHVEAFDERRVVSERIGAAFVVFVYAGGGPHTSWSVDSRLLNGADLAGVRGWLESNLPHDCCWSLGVIQDPVSPGPDDDLAIAWIDGADVLNTDPADRTPTEQRIAEAMLARRHRVTSIQRES